MKGEVKPLTGLRGVAAVIVMLYHYGQPYAPLGVTTHFRVPQGYLAVDCFYILSGFVLAYSYGGWFSAGLEWSRFFDFMLRRIARLYPAYLFIMAIVFLKTVVNFSGNGALAHYGVFDLVMNGLMMTGVGLGVYPVIGDSWSVSAEMVAYLFFPVLVLLAVFSRPAVGWLACIAASGLLLLVMHSGLGRKGPLDVVSSASFYPVLRCLAGFTIGLLVYRVSSFAARLSWLGAELLCGFAVCATILCWFLHAPDGVLFICLALLVFTLAFDGGIANRLFGNRPVHRLGEISYSLYLIHPTFISVSITLARHIQNRTGIHWAYPVLACVGWIVSIKLAGLSARWIEQPGRRWIMASVARAEQPKIA